MKTRFLALAAVLAVAMGLTGCGKEEQQFEVEVEGPKKPGVSASSPVAQTGGNADGSIVWTVEPRQDLEMDQSLADFDNLEGGKLTNQKSLSFFVQDGKRGVIDQEGKILVPAQEDVHWCSLCGIVTDMEEKTFDGQGNDTGSGGHGGLFWPRYYVEENQTLYQSTMGETSEVREEYRDEVQDAQLAELIETGDDIMGIPMETESGTKWMDIEPKEGWVLVGKDGSLLANGQRFEEIGGVNAEDSGRVNSSPAQEGMVLVKTEGQWNFLTSAGEKAHGPYLDARPYEGGIAAVKTDTGWGFVDKSGKPLTRMDFLGATSAANGRAWVRTTEGWGVIELAKNPAPAEG